MAGRKTQKRKTQKRKGGTKRNRGIILGKSDSIERGLKKIYKENPDIPKNEIRVEVETLLELPVKKLKQMDEEDAQTTILKPQAIKDIIKLKKDSKDYIINMNEYKKMLPNQMDHQELYGEYWNNHTSSRKSKKSRTRS